jgi:hypothetical protein
MNKTLIRGGHNFQAVGCSGLIDETTEDRKVKDAVIKYLTLDGGSVLDGSPGNCDVNTDLAYGVSMANNVGVNYAASIHFNKAYDAYNGAIGSEVWLNPNDSNSVSIANRILSNLEALGFQSRGLKDGINGEHLYEVRNSHSIWQIIEVCFVEATEDVRIYKAVGADGIGKAIAEGIVGHTIVSTAPVKIERNGFNMFNKNYYLKTNPDVAAAVAKGVTTAEAHYNDYGKKEGRRPIPQLPNDFTEGIYLTSNPDVAKAVHNLIVTCGAEHWLTDGWSENRKYK